MTVTALVYDLDGTLIDSSGHIAAGINRVRKARGLSPLDTPTVIASVGDGAGRLVERVLFGRGLEMRPRPADVLSWDPRVFETAFAELRAIYEGELSRGLVPYEGVLQALDHWQQRGVPQAILTNKPHGPAVAVVEALGLSHLFAGVLGAGVELDGEPLRAKPDPRGLSWLIEAMGVAPEGVWMVGDGPQDVRVGQLAGVKTLALTSGFSSAELLRGLQPPPSLVADSFREGFEMLRGEAGATP